MIEIKNRYTGEVIFTHEGDSLVEADFTGANLSGADFTGANLSGANCSGANLYGAYFTGANLREVNFTGANCSGANLSGANFTGCRLYGADFTGADLTGATLLGHKVTKAPLQISGLTWPVLITEQAMAIGCQTHTHEQWENFTGDELANMDSQAFEFAEKWRTFLLGICHEHAKA